MTATRSKSSRSASDGRPGQGASDLPRALLRAFSETGRKALLKEWMAGLSQDPTCGELNAMGEVRFLCERFLEALGEAIQTRPWDPAQPHFKDPVKTVSFIGGWLGENKATPSWAGLLTPHLRRAILKLAGKNAIPDELVCTLETMGAAAVETYHKSIEEHSDYLHQELIRRSSPVVRLPGNVPLLMVIGDPSRGVIDELMSRVMVETIRIDAGGYVVDLSGLEGNLETVCDSLSEIARHRKMVKRRLVLVGATREVKAALKAFGLGPRAYLTVDRLEDAVARAADIVPPGSNR